MMMQTPARRSIPSSRPAHSPAVAFGSLARSLHDAAASLARPATLRAAQAQVLRLITVVAGH